MPYMSACKKEQKRGRAAMAPGPSFALFLSRAAYPS